MAARGLQVSHVEFDVKEGGSPVERFDPESAGATRQFLVNWIERGIAAYQVLGYPQIDNSDPMHPKITRYLPDQHPDFPWMVARKITSMRGVGATGCYNVILPNGTTSKAANYSLCLMTVEYEFPPYDVLEDDYISSEFDRFRTFDCKPSGQYFAPPQTGWVKWAEGPHGPSNPRGALDFPGNVGFIQGSIDYHWDWLEIPYAAIPMRDIMNTIGCVNDSDWPVGDGQGTVAAAGTLLLTGAEPRRCNSPFGSRTWKISYTANFNPYGHNNFYDFQDDTPGVSHFYQVSKDGAFHPIVPGMTDGLLVYNARSFNNLFTPPPP